MTIQDNSAVTRRNADTDWLSKAQLGAFMHYLPNQREFGFIPQFDVSALAEQLADAGAAYLGFTLGQNIGFYNAPNPVYDRIVGVAAGERCSQRDLPMELANALREKGIRLMLYLPCQTPNQDLQAVKAFGFPEEPLDGDRQILPAAAEKWAEVIEWWSVHYGELVSGWWFDGGYEWCGFNDAIATLYASAVKKGNPHSIATYNPGISLKRATAAEDYVAGELREPFEQSIDDRWLDDSQAHVLTYIGDLWGQPNCRFADEEWIPWLRRCFRSGAAVTLDMRGNRAPENGTVGLFDSDQIAQFKRLREATRL
ncbi:MAG: hypothetical protein J5833_04975 [Victivallales bacterium]|nr:hypothetical protein [Victivallales bacterium]